MARSANVLQEWGMPLFLSMTPEARDLYMFLLYSPPPTSPLGLIWYGGDSALPISARKAGVGFVSGIPALESSGMAQHDPELGIVYLPHALNAASLGLYSSRNIIAWGSRVGKMPESPLRDLWVKNLLGKSKGCKKQLHEKVQLIFGGEAAGGESKTNSKAVDIVRHFSDRFAESGYGDYVANWAREVAIAKELLVTLEAEDIINRIDLYFKDEWLSQNASMDFISFRRNINKFAKSAKSMPSKKDYSGYWDIIKNVGESN